MLPNTSDHNTTQHTYTFSNNLHIPIPNIKQEQPTHTPTEHINKTIYKGYCFTEIPSHPPTFPTQAAHVFDTCKCLSMFCTKPFPKGCFSLFIVLFPQVNPFSKVLCTKLLCNQSFSQRFQQAHPFSNVILPIPFLKGQLGHSFLKAPFPKGGVAPFPKGVGKPGAAVEALVCLSWGGVTCLYPYFTGIVCTAWLA